MTLVETIVPARITRRLWDGTHPSRRRGDPDHGTATIARDTDVGVAFFAAQIVDAWPLFEPGDIVATTGLVRHLGANGADPEVVVAELLRRHLSGDYGRLPVDDHSANDVAVLYGTRVLSAYVEDEVSIFVITEADRSSTTLLIAAEY